MKKINVFLVAILLIVSIMIFSACASRIPSDDSDKSELPSPTPPSSDTSPDEESFGIAENPIISTAEQDNINFSIDVNTANYSLFKNMVLDKDNAYHLRRQDLAKIAQIDQMLNYFDYNYSTPEGDVPLALTASVFDSPYNSTQKLMTIGLSAKENKLNATANNIVILLDVSGSMSSETKLGMAKRSILMMVENMSENDKISLVTYAGSAQKVFEGISASDYETIEKAVNALSASGSTNGEDGLNLAYSCAAKNFIEDGNNRVILMSDGDFNVGISSTNSLIDFISRKRNEGVYLSCIGFGSTYDYSIETMEALSKYGNGNWGYIHNDSDAKKLLVDGLDSMLVTIAKDVKSNIQFNKDIVKSFRLLGYENNILSDEEYEDDKTDAGEIGSGFTLTICFELQLHEGIDLLTNEANFAQINVKYKLPGDTISNPSKELTLPVEASCYKSELSNDDIFVSSVVEFALIAINSTYKAQASIDNVISRLQGLEMTDKYRLEFLEVVKTYNELFFS